MPAAAPHTLSSAWAIELTGDHPVARFAAEELRRTLQRLGAPALPIVDSARGRRIALRHGDDGDGFVRVPDAAGLTLNGDGPRGLLYAVYDLLEALGCRWVAPGPTGERLPRLERVTLPQVAVAQRPALRGRCLIIGHDYFLDDAEAWIVWAARNRLNTLFIHSIDQRLALGACHIWRWHARRKALLPLLHERGMVLELGGHGLSDLVPRHLFHTTPDAFRYDGTQRKPDFNFCPSSREALTLLRRNGAAFFRAHPEADVYHLWPDDILGGGWCRCPACALLTPSDQALSAVNELADELAAIKPSATLAYLAYHDTEAPPSRIAPRPNVTLLYAPRPRSYAHGIGDEASAVNQPFFQHLLGNLDWFRNPTKDPAASSGQAEGRKTKLEADPSLGTQARVFEYYLDGILFKSAPPPLPTVLRADLRAYRDCGVHTVQALMTGDRPWLAAPLNAYLFARLAWEPEQDPNALLAAYAAVRAPRTPEALVCAYRALAAAWQPALDFTPGEREVQSDDTHVKVRRPSLLSRLNTRFHLHLPLPNLSNPPRDVLDYMAAPRLLRERRLEAFAAIAPRLEQGRAAWIEVLAQAHADEATLRAEAAEWELGAQLLRFFTLRQQLYVLEAREAPRAGLRAALAEAQAALDALKGWGQAQIAGPQARANFALLRLLAQLHLDVVHNRRLSWPWQRPAARMQIYVHILRYVSRLIL